VLRAPAVISRPFDAAARGALRDFLSHLKPERLNVYVAARRFAERATLTERWYGCRYAVEPLASAGLLGAWGGPLPPLSLPAASWALPADLRLRPAAPGAPPPGAPPAVVLEEPGLRLWHAQAPEHRLPKVHARFRLAPTTPGGGGGLYATPASWMAARLCLAVVRDVLMPQAYAAELAGTHYDLSAESSGALCLHVRGFSDVAPRLLRLVLGALTGLTAVQVAERLEPQRGRMARALASWAQQNPSDHAAYYESRLLLAAHHGVEANASALAALTADDVLRRARARARLCRPAGRR